MSALIGIFLGIVFVFFILLPLLGAFDFHVNKKVTDVGYFIEYSPSLHEQNDYPILFVGEFEVPEWTAKYWVPAEGFNFQPIYSLTSVSGFQKFKTLQDAQEMIARIRWYIANRGISTIQVTIVHCRCIEHAHEIKHIFTACYQTTGVQL